MNYKVLLTSSMMLVLSLLSVPSHAIPGDRQKPIQLKADKVDIDYERGYSTYRGNVVLKQGTLEIYANKVIVERFPKKQTFKAVVSGKPARFKQQIDEKGKMVQAEALRMTYSTESEILLLERRAKVTSGNDRIASPSIKYNLKQNRVVADRVNITLDPNTLEPVRDE